MYLHLWTSLVYIPRGIAFLELGGDQGSRNFGADFLKIFHNFFLNSKFFSIVLRGVMISLRIFFPNISRDIIVIKIFLRGVMFTWFNLKEGHKTGLIKKFQRRLAKFYRGVMTDKWFSKTVLYNFNHVLRSS